LCPESVLSGTIKFGKVFELETGGRSSVFRTQIALL
jgi:hypothetical protein